METQAVKSQTDKLLSVLSQRRRLLVLTHTNPDPDSLASGLGLSLLAKTKLGLASDMGLCGRIMRAENKEMVQSLKIPLIPMGDLRLANYDCLAVVDTQPGFGHTKLPEGRDIDIVIDHHVGPEVGRHEFLE